MLRSTLVLLGLSAFWMSGGCDGDAPANMGSSAHFALPGSGALAWGDVPFPSDLYRNADGNLDIGALRSDAEVWDAIRARLNQRDGFCTSCGIYFPIDGELDAESLPDSAESVAQVLGNSAIVLVNADENSPDYGALVPLAIDWMEPIGVLGVRPMRGIVLAPSTPYVAALTSALRDDNGDPLRAPPELAKLLGGDPLPGDLGARALDDVTAALAALDDAGVATDTVVSLTRFTTGDPRPHLEAVRDAVLAANLGAITVDAVYRADEGDFDDILGIPAENRPGIDVLPVEGEAGTTAIVHETVEFAVAGHFEAPRFVTGSPPESGVPLLSAEGLPVPGDPEDVYFLLIIPDGVDPTSVPVVVYHPGLATERQTGFAAADTAGRAGAAVLAIEPYLHGARAATAQDTRHDLRGDADDPLGPDGFSEEARWSLVLQWLGVADTEVEPAASPGYLLGAFTQQVADSVAVLRLAREGDWSGVAEGIPELAGFALDTEHLMWFGVSNGSFTGSLVLNIDDSVGAAVLNVGPGSLTDVLCGGPSFRPITDLSFAPSLDLRGSYDDVTMKLCDDPSFDLFRWALEPVDPGALAPFFLRNEEFAQQPNVLFQIAAFDETVPPFSTRAALTAAGVPIVTDAELIDGDPVVDNWDTPLGDRTVVAVEYADGTHLMVGLAEDRRTVETPIEPPFTRLAEALTVAQPIVQVHQQIQSFFATYLETGHAQVQ